MLNFSFYLYRVLFRIKYSSLWDIKHSLQNNYNNNLAHYYNILLSKGGNYIGYTSTFKNIPVFPHGLNGVFISGGAVIGKNCVIFQQVTIGSNTLKDSNIGAPKLGDNVYIGAGAKIIGNITIGNNCRIGANAVVYKNMPHNSVAVCATTRILQKEKLNNRFYKKINNNWYYYDNENWIKDEID